MPGFAEGGTCAKPQGDLFPLDEQRVRIEDLHRHARRSNLEGEARFGIKRYALGDLAENAVEFSDRHEVVLARSEASP